MMSTPDKTAGALKDDCRAHPDILWFDPKHPRLTQGTFSLFVHGTSVRPEGR